LLQFPGHLALLPSSLIVLVGHYAALDISLMLEHCLGCCQANEKGEESQSKRALEEMKQQIAKLQKGLSSYSSVSDMFDNV